MILAFRLAALLMVALLGGSGCTSKKEAAQASKAAQAQSPARTLNLAVWSNYIAPELIAEFEKVNGIKVNIYNYS